MIGKNQNVDSIMQSVISGFDASTVIQYLGSPDQIKSWAENVTKGLENSDVQSSINQLFQWISINQKCRLKTMKSM